MNTIKSKSKHIYKELVTKQDDSPHASNIIVKLDWILRVSLLSFGIAEIVRGELVLGVMIIVSVLFLVAPSFFTREKINDIPLEIEFFLFIIILFQFVIGEAGGFYRKIAYYDKITHFVFPFVVSVIGFTIAYSLYTTKKLNLSVKTMVLFIILTTIGIGALWEIAEYSSDKFLLPHFHNLHRFQGPDPADAYFDTMTDLIDDLLGGIVGSLVASRYILERKYNKRIKELLLETGRNFFRKKQKKK